MRRLLLLFVLLCSIVINAQTVYRRVEPYEGIRQTIDDFSVCLPSNCKYNENKSVPDEYSFCLTTPDETFSFYYCYFPYDDSFDQQERLIGECAEMGMEVTGDGDVIHMVLNNSTYMTYTFDGQLGVGIVPLYPNDKVGLCFFVLIEGNDDNSEQIHSVLNSVRIKK